MSEGAPKEGRALNDLILAEPKIDVLISKTVLERTPFIFDSEDQYLTWRSELATGLELDSRDVTIVGSGATGRSFNPRNQFGTFNSKSDIDIAVVSDRHFETSWFWFRQTDPNTLGLDAKGLHLFGQHRAQYVYDGYIASDYFLAFLPFGNEWLRALRRCEQYLPARVQGKAAKVRIFKDNQALRNSQRSGIASYKRVLEKKQEARDDQR